MEPLLVAFHLFRRSIIEVAVLRTQSDSFPVVLLDDNRAFNIRVGRGMAVKEIAVG